MARGLAPLHSNSHTACAGLTTAAQPNGGEPPRHRFASASDLGFASASCCHDSDQNPKFEEGDIPWRGGLPPLGREAAPLHSNSHTACAGLTTAAQPNGGKPPRHRLARASDLRLPSAICCHDSNQNPNLRKGDIPWRGGLPPLGREAAPCISPITPHAQDWRLLRSRTGASPLATG